MNKPIRLVNNCGAIYHEATLIKAIQWLAELMDQRIYSIKTVFMYGRYPAISVGGIKQHIHRLIWQQYAQGSADEDMVVHHKNGNRLDARLDNLVPIHQVEHGSLHNRGKTLTVEHRRKIGESNKRRCGMRIKKHRPDVTPERIRPLLDRGLSINAVAMELDCCWDTIKNRIHENLELLKKD